MPDNLLSSRSLLLFGIALISTPGFGIKSPAPFNSASALFAAIAFRSTAFVSSSLFGGSSGRLFYGVARLCRTASTKLVTKSTGEMQAVPALCPPQQQFAEL
jgi:hypothetical protein